MDLEASFARPEMKHLQKYAFAAARIRHEEPGKVLGYSDLRDWESDDLIDFIRHYSEQESARSAAFRKKAGATGNVEVLEAAIEQMMAAGAGLRAAASAVLDAARAAHVPLDGSAK
jgi:hypothetical protein